MRSLNYLVTNYSIANNGEINQMMMVIESSDENHHRIR
jgi:hypothetical protein